ncbi:hypothetical protein [Rhodopila sp.]|uniref:hypothetical protein n=1 Tax=Rhodopila sp. TaxID=2480087 RepID=UPI003D0CFFBD
MRADDEAQRQFQPVIGDAVKHPRVQLDWLDAEASLQTLPCFGRHAIRIDRT